MCVPVPFGAGDATKTRPPLPPKCVGQGIGVSVSCFRALAPVSGHEETEPLPKGAHDAMPLQGPRACFRLLPKVSMWDCAPGSLV